MGCALENTNSDHLVGTYLQRDRRQWRGSRADSPTLEIEALRTEIIIMTELITRVPSEPGWLPIDTTIAERAGLDIATRTRLNKLVLAPIKILHYHNESRDSNFVPLVRARHVLALCHGGTEEEFLTWYKAATWNAADIVIQTLRRTNTDFDLDAVRNALADTTERTYVDDRDRWVQ